MVHPRKAGNETTKLVLDAAYKGSLRGQVGIHFGEYPLR
jgi:hypothetical protein